MIRQKNKRGWLRVVEATIGVILIMGAVLIHYQKTSVTSGIDFSANIPILVDEISKNSTLRSEIIGLDSSNVNDVKNVQNQVNLFLTNKMVRSDLNYSVIICKADGECALPKQNNLDGDVYGYERIISTGETNSFDPLITPKKIKLYVWQIK